MFKQVMKKIGVIVLALTLLILDLTLLGAFPLLTQDGKFSLVEQIGYGIWALGSLAIFIVIAHNATMENQDALNKIFIHVPTYLKFAVVGFIVPIMEEIIFRGLLAKVLFGKYFKTGLVISSLLFMAGHSAFTLQTIVIYGVMSAGLAITYYKTKRIEYSMGVHILNNSISVLLSLFV